MNTKNIGVFVGSLRKNSFSQSIAQAVMVAAPQDLALSQVSIADLQMFNQDYDDDGRTPAEWTIFRNAVKALDGFLFITPEYNRSVPPVLKNAIDIASRPPQHNLWSGKPGGIISVSPGKIGGFGANHHLRQTLSCINVLTMQQPEAYISNVTALLDEGGRLSDERTSQLIHTYMDAFSKWVKVCS